MTKLFAQLRVGVSALLCAIVFGMEAHAQSGFVRSADQPIPGATVSATQPSQTLSTVTDRDGHYVFPPLAAGKWSVTVEMFGFETLKQDVDYASAPGAVNFNLQLKESPVLQRLRQFAARQEGSAPGATPG